MSAAIAGTTIGSGAEQRVVEERDVAVGTFVSREEGYYQGAFEKIERGVMPRWHSHLWALVVPWLWSAYRGLWLMFWVSLAIDVIAVVCMLQVVKFSPLLAEALLARETPGYRIV